MTTAPFTKCRNCGEEKPSEEFYAWRPGWCKTCAAYARKKAREKNPEQYREYQRRAVLKNPERHRKRNRAYVDALRELRDLHKEEFDVIYHENMERAGLVKTPGEIEEAQAEVVEEAPDTEVEVDEWGAPLEREIPEPEVEPEPAPLPQSHQPRTAAELYGIN